MLASNKGKILVPNRKIKHSPPMQYKFQSKAWILKAWSRDLQSTLKLSQGSASKTTFIIIMSFAFFSLILFQALQSSFPVVH